MRRRVGIMTAMIVVAIAPIGNKSIMEKEI
jgi:hypothetical protein